MYPMPDVGVLPVSGQEHTPRHSVSVAGVVVDDVGRILVIRRRDNGQWQIPGGILELDESLESGTRREILEETGVHVQIDRLTGVYKNRRVGVVALVFLGRPCGGGIHPTVESSAVEWVSREEARRRMDDMFFLRVEDALSGETRHRTHDGVSLLDP